MLGSTGEGDDRFNQGAGRYSLYVLVEDPDAHLARASEAGAAIERELSDTDYGSREYTARDPEGNLWSFGTYRPEARLSGRRHARRARARSTCARRRPGSA